MSDQKMSVFKQVKGFIKNRKLLNLNDQLVVGVSGGPDSLALLHILTKLQSDYQLKLHVAHLNHKLRGEAARRDAQFVEKIADEWNLSVTVEARDVKAYQQQESLSLEEAARKVRYDFLLGLVEKLNFDKLVVGHHADDQAETVLMNFIRGAGLKGLGGINPEARGVVRPLLNVTKEELKQYCKKYELNPCFDATNAQSNQLRNKIRLELIPLLKENYNQNLTATLNRSAEIFRQEDKFLRSYARRQLEEIMIKEAEAEIRVATKQLLRYDLALQRRIVREGLHSLVGTYKDFYYQHIEAILELAGQEESGKQLDLPQGVIVGSNYDQLIFSTHELAADIDYFEVKASIGQTRIPELELLVKSEVFPSSYSWEKESQKSKIACLDFSQIGTEFFIRQRQPGDSFKPLGLQGTKKIKDFFIDEQIPRWQRDKTPIFTTRSGRIFWVGGIRIDDRFKITETTDQILRVELIDLS
jgi:tRNA(Ile)-lysidine synthase